MDGFRFDVQTSVYYGRNALQDHQNVLDGFGKKAVIVTSQFIEGYKNIGLEDAKALFDAKGIEYKVIDIAGSHCKRQLHDLDAQRHGCSCRSDDSAR